MQLIPMIQAAAVQTWSIIYDTTIDINKKVILLCITETKESTLERADLQLFMFVTVERTGKCL